jgi:hypothetical protein
VTTAPPISILTWLVVAPFFTSTTVPLSLLRALSFIIFPYRFGSAQSRGRPAAMSFVKTFVRLIVF